MNQKPYNKQPITSFARSVRKSIFVRFFCIHLARSVRKLQANTFPYFNILLCILLLFFASEWLMSHDFFSRIYINSLDFLFIQCFSLTNGQRSKRQTSLSISALHQPFYILISNSTLTISIHQRQTSLAISAVHQPFLYFDLHLNTAQDAAYQILCFSLTKGLRSKHQTSLIFRFVYFNTTFISICLFTYRNKKCQCFS